MMIARRSPLSRRALIRGLGGVAIALPFLDAMIPESLIGSAEAAARKAKAMPKNRFSLLYYPNGLESDYWYPKTGEGADYDLTGTSMEPASLETRAFSPSTSPSWAASSGCTSRVQRSLPFTSTFTLCIQLFFERMWRRLTST